MDLFKQAPLEKLYTGDHFSEHHTTYFKQRPTTYNLRKEPRLLAYMGKTERQMSK